MKRATKIISFLLAAVMAFSAPVCANASTTTDTIFIPNAKYVHQTKMDGFEISEGIDVSYHNSDIDFKKVKAAGVKFVIMRVGYRAYGSTGSINSDRKFTTYIKDAHDAGLDIGVYFYSQAITEAEAREEANFVINTIKNYKSYINLPVAYDYEFADVSSGRLDSAWRNGKIDKTDMTNNCFAFCRTIEAAGYSAMIYANKSFLSDNVDHTQLEKYYPIWLAHYIKNTNYSGDYDIWQFSSTGRINGISGNVDSNFMYNKGFKVSSIGTQVYSGKALQPAVTVTYNGKKLTKNTDYKVTYTNNTEVGVGTATVEGLGNYQRFAKASKSFTIIPKALTGMKLDKAHSTTLTVSWDKYNGMTGYEPSIKTPSGWVYPEKTTQNTYTFKDLTPSTSYEISIRAYKVINGVTYGGYWGREYLKASTTAAAPSVPANYTGWYKFNDEWFYYVKGVMQKGWVKVDNKWYYLDKGGVMQTGWLEDGGKTYYLNARGEMLTYMQKIEGKTYYFNGAGAMYKGWLTINSNGKKYYFGSDGAAHTGWHTIDGKTYLFDSNGVMQKGWIDLNGSTYYLTAEGVMLKYLQTIDDEKYYFYGSGKLYKGWLDIKDKKYYFSEDDGRMLKGWQKINNKTYYLGTDGAMVKYIQAIDGEKYYFYGNGIMHTGWLKIKDKWYYFSTNDGKMQKGWIKVGGKNYYLGTDGAMLVYLQIIDGKKYYFYGSGVMHTGWLKIKDKWYYFSPSHGAMVTGKQTINGKSYTFDSNGVCQNP